MVDRGLRDDFQRIRLGKAGRGWSPDHSSGGGVPAFLGQVTTAEGLIGVGKFLMVQPTVILGSEVEAGLGQISTVGSTSVPVYLVGPGTPVTGDDLVCRFVDNRWVAERSSGSGTGGGGGVTIPSCFCSEIPASLTMTSDSPTCNYGMFQSCSLQYGATPDGYADLDLGVNSFLSAESFPDEIGGGAMYQYLLTCLYNQFNLSRVYLDSPYGSPFRDGVLYSWIIGGYGNTCTPFHLDNGVAYPGSDASCFVKIDG